MRVLISSDTILNATEEFLDWRVFGFFFSFVNVMFRALFIGITRTKVLTLNAVVMALTNVLLDYLLIFGNCGFPELGIKGAAIASVMAEAVSIVFYMVYTRMTVDIKKYALSQFRSFDVKLLRRVLDISIFTMLQYFISLSTYFMLFVAVEHLGQRELAVANIVRSVYIVLLIPVNSLSTATNTFVSNSIGAGHKDQVIPIIRHITWISLGIMAVFVSVTCLIPSTILSVYTNDVSFDTSFDPFPLCDFRRFADRSGCQYRVQRSDGYGKYSFGFCDGAGYPGFLYIVYICGRDALAYAGCYLFHDRGGVLYRFIGRKCHLFKESILAK